MARTRRSRAVASTASKADPATDTLDVNDNKDIPNGDATTTFQEDSEDDNKGAAQSPEPAVDAEPTTSKPFKGCAIAVSGNFVSVGHKLGSMRQLIRDLGGMTPSSITKSTTHIICPSNQLLRRRQDSARMKVPALKPEWIIDCESKKRRLPEADYIWDFTQVMPTGETITAADVLAQAISNGLIISPTNGSAPTPTTTAAAALKPGKRARNGAGDAEFNAEEADKEKPKKKKRKPAAKRDPAPAPEASGPADDGAKDGEPAEGQFAKKKDIVIPIDEFCPLRGYKVYVDPDSGMIYDASLNQSNATHNRNKFYRDQVVVDPKKGTYKTWTRWGRVGDVGQSAMLGDGSLADAIKLFEKKFKDKSGLAWDDRGNNPKAGKYAFVERSYNPDSDDEDGEPKTTKVKREGDHTSPKAAECTLEKPLQDLMELIFSKTYMQNAMTALNYDANKLPLGKLSKNTISHGFQKLNDLAALLDDPKLANTQWQMTFPAARELLSNTYYSLIPHDFGRQRPPVIADDNLLKKEVDLLHSLSDMKDATNIMKIDRKKATAHPTDLQYQGLGMKEMTALDPTSKEFTLLKKYLNATRGSTHNVMYKVQNIWRIERPGEHERFDKFSLASIKSDRRLLWHGSRCTNYGGILSQGLRIAPPEAPVSGYMFGKGIYLADISSKSASYCCSYNSNGHALLLLCDAELGRPMQKLTCASYDAGDTAKADGKVATHGLGRIGPLKWVDAGAVHPSLKGVKMPDPKHVPGDTNVKNASLYYNEYIAYDVAQVRLRYLLRVSM